MRLRKRFLHVGISTAVLSLLPTSSSEHACHAASNTNRTRLHSTNSSPLQTITYREKKRDESAIGLCGATRMDSTAWWCGAMAYPGVEPISIVSVKVIAKKQNKDRPSESEKNRDDGEAFGRRLPPPPPPHQLFDLVDKQAQPVCISVSGYILIHGQRRWGG